MSTTKTKKKAASKSKAPTAKARSPKAAGKAKKAKPKKAGGEKKPKRVSALDAAAQVLAKAAEPMGAKDLIAAMAEQGLWSSPAGKTPHATLYAAMLREIAKKGNAARFKKVGRDHVVADPQGHLGTHPLGRLPASQPLHHLKLHIRHDRFILTRNRGETHLRPEAVCAGAPSISAP